MRTSLNLFVLFAAVSITLPCYAGTSTSKSQPDDVRQLRKVVEQQGRQMKEQQVQIEELRSRVGAKDKALEIRGGQGESRQKQRQSTAADPKTKKKTASNDAGQSQEQLPSQPVGRPPEKQPISKQYKEIEAIFRQQGVLTPRGTLVLEPSMQYAYSTSTRVVLNGFTIIPALTVGLIDVRSVNRSTYIPALSARYGLTERLELQVYAPYVFRDDSSVESSLNTTSNDQVFNASGDNIGDVQFGLRYQFNMPLSGGPIFIGGLLAKSNTGKDPFHVPTDSLGNETELPTGTGFWGIQPSVSIIYPSDPVVFFGSVNYLYNFSEKYPIKDSNGNNVQVEIEPGGTFGFNFGMGFSMNEKTSFSVGYEHYIVASTDIHSSAVTTSASSKQNTTLGSLVFGAAYRLNDRVTINFSLEGGLTEAAPDVQLTLRVPFSI
jgi:hypothetical protein